MEIRRGAETHPMTKADAHRLMGLTTQRVPTRRRVVRACGSISRVGLYAFRHIVSHPCEAYPDFYARLSIEAAGFVTRQMFSCVPA